MDPISLLMAAQATVAAIKRGCELLSEGKQEISKLKQTVEQGVGDAKALYGELTGLWGWIKGLFGGKPKAAQVVISDISKKRVDKKKEQRHEASLTYEEYKSQVIHQQVEHLKVLFQTLRQLREVAENLKEESATTDDIEGSALSRVEIELGIDDMMKQVREAMVYAPKELRDIYSRFLKMYQQILEEQEFARQVNKKQEKDRQWRRYLLRNHRIDRAILATTVVLTILWMWGMMLSLGWLERTPGGLQPL